MSSYSTSSTLGAPSGAGGSRNGVQSATESRTSRLTTPLNFFAIAPSSESSDVVARQASAAREQCGPHPVQVRFRMRPVHGWLGRVSGAPSTARASWLPALAAGLPSAGGSGTTCSPALAAGTVVIPQAMAYATIAGLPVEVGLYTCMLPMIVYALLGGSRSLSISTTSTIAILTASTLAPCRDDRSAATTCSRRVHAHHARRPVPAGDAALPARLAGRADQPGDDDRRQGRRRPDGRGHPAARPCSGVTRRRRGRGLLRQARRHALEARRR